MAHTLTEWASETCEPLRALHRLVKGLRRLHAESWKNGRRCVDHRLHLACEVGCIHGCIHNIGAAERCNVGVYRGLNLGLGSRETGCLELDLVVERVLVAVHHTRGPSADAASHGCVVIVRGFLQILDGVIKVKQRVVLRHVVRVGLTQLARRREHLRR